jgi:AbrB family looped-hinge helix DNA binding protein
MAATVTTKGQVTIPKEVRDLLGIKPGSAVSFEVAEDGRVVLSKVDRRGPTTRPPSRFAKLRGRASAGMTTEEIMALTRSEE